MKPVRPLEDGELRRLDQLVAGRSFAEAAALVDVLVGNGVEDRRLAERAGVIQESQRQKEQGVRWSGEVAHLFTHSLIAQPALAFDGDAQEPGYQENMLTRLEFERILGQMYDRGWILVDIRDLYREDSDGQIIETPLLLPPGRKPFVLSVDDVSYYDYMTGNGFAERLDVDSNLDVATVFVEPDGNERWTTTGDVMPVLDRFIWDNPDFSHLGAKGIIALTGYEGIFGYDVSRDQVDELDFAERQAGAHRVAQRLRELGWEFASHSYTHHGDMRDRTMSFGRFRFDAENWRAEVGVYVGETDLYVSPYGYHMSNDNPLFRFLIEDEGFNVYAPISDGTTIVFNEDNLVSERRSLDGYALKYFREELQPYFDADSIWDEARGSWPID